MSRPDNGVDGGVHDGGAVGEQEKEERSTFFSFFFFLLLLYTRHHVDIVHAFSVTLRAQDNPIVPIVRRVNKQAQDRLGATGRQGTPFSPKRCPAPGSLPPLNYWIHFLCKRVLMGFQTGPPRIETSQRDPEPPPLSSPDPLRLRRALSGPLRPQGPRPGRRVVASAPRLSTWGEGRGLGGHCCHPDRGARPRAFSPLISRMRGTSQGHHTYLS